MLLIIVLAMGNTVTSDKCPPAATRTTCLEYTSDCRDGYETCKQANLKLHSDVAAARASEQASLSMYRSLAARHSDLEHRCAVPIVGASNCAKEAEAHRLNHFRCLSEKSSYLERLAQSVPRSQIENCDSPARRERYLEEAINLARRMTGDQEERSVPVSAIFRILFNKYLNCSKPIVTKHYTHYWERVSCPRIVNRRSC